MKDEIIYDHHRDGTDRRGFTAPATNDYYCSIHPDMKGKAIVR